MSSSAIYINDFLKSLTPAQLAEVANTLSNTTKENGFGITSFSILVIVCFIFLGIFTFIFYIMFKNLLKQQAESRKLLEKEHSQERTRMYELNKEMIDIFKESNANQKESIRDFYCNIEKKTDQQTDRLNNFIEMTHDLFNIQYEKTIEILKGDKKLSIKQFDVQVKQIIKAQVYEIFDRLYEKVENNNLLNNRDNNCGYSFETWQNSEIWRIFEEHLKFGADLIDSLGYSDERLSIRLYFEVEKHAKDAAIKCIEVFKVNEGYRKDFMTRVLRNIKKDCMIKIMALKLMEL